MGKNRIPALVPLHQRNGKRLEIKPASDSAKLTWTEIMGPLNNAAHAFNAVINQTTQRVVQDLANRDGIDLKQYVLNVDTLQWVPREQANDAAVAHSGP